MAQASSIHHVERTAPELLVAGAGGFIGQAVLRTAATVYPRAVVPVPREDAVQRITSPGRRDHASPRALLVLAWPTLPHSRSEGIADAKDGDDWATFLRWLGELVKVAVDNDVRVWGVGSGVESLVHPTGSALKEPYLGYARRKLEVKALLHAEVGVSASWARLHFLFGKGESPSRFVPAAIAAANAGKDLEVGAPDVWRHWLHVDDAARYLLHAIATGHDGEIDIAGRQPVTNRMICSLVAQSVGRPLVIRPAERAPADAACAVVPAVAVPAYIGHEAGTPAQLRGRLDQYAEECLGPVGRAHGGR